LKKIIIFLVLLSMLLSALVPIIANAQPDDLFLSSGEILRSLNVLQGNKDKNLMLDNKLKRQDMIVLMSRLYKEENSLKTNLIKANFTDIEDSFYETYINWAVAKGLIIGMDKDTFGFNEHVTVQQFMTVLLRVLGYDEESKLWDTVPDIASNLGIMKDLNLNPNSHLTRGQMAVMTLNTLNLTIKGSTLPLAEALNLKM